MTVTAPQTTPFDPVEVDLPGELKRLLGLIAEGGLVGETVGEVAAYLIKRGIDDLLRCGAIKIGGDA